MWSPFGPFWSVKYLSFGQKLPTWTTYHTFLESKHPKVTKNPYYVLSPEGTISEKMKINTQKWLTFYSIFIKLWRLLKIRTSVPNYETLTKSKTWGANYKIDETCWKRQFPNDFV